MSEENPNAQIEANLLEGIRRYSAAGQTLQDIETDLDNIAAGLQSAWLGGAYRKEKGSYRFYQPKVRIHTKLCSVISISDNPCRSGELASPV